MFTCSIVILVYTCSQVPFRIGMLKQYRQQIFSMHESRHKHKQTCELLNLQTLKLFLRRSGKKIIELITKILQSELEALILV